MQHFTPFQVDDVHYQMLYLPPSKSIKVLTRLMKLISDPLGKGMGSIQSDTPGNETFLDQEVNVELIGKAITALGERLDEALVWNTITELLSTVEKQTDEGGFCKVNVETDFSGRIGHLIKVIAKTIEVNYNDFLGQVLTGLKRFRKGKPSKGPSTGSSGDPLSNESQQDRK